LLTVLRGLSTTPTTMGGAKPKKFKRAQPQPMFISNAAWAMSYLDESDVEAVRKRVEEEAREELKSSHSQHRLNHLKMNLKFAQEDAAALTKQRRVLIDEYTKAHYKVAPEERVVYLPAKEKPKPPDGKIMKGLIENTFAGGIKPDLVDAQMYSTLREKHLTGEAVQRLPGKDMPVRKLTLISNPLMAPDIPYNRKQDSCMPTLMSTAKLDRGGPMQSGRSSMPTQEREDSKFRSLSRFLTSGKEKYMQDPVLVAAMGKLMSRAKQIDGNSDR